MDRRSTSTSYNQSRTLSPSQADSLSRTLSPSTMDNSQASRSVMSESSNNVFREVLGRFESHNMVRFQTESQFRYENDVQFEQSHVAWLFLEIGVHFECVKRQLRAQKQSLVMKNLEDVIQKKLTSCHKIVSVLSEENDAENLNQDILKRLLPWSRDTLMVLKLIATVLNETQDVRGGAVLTPIYHKMTDPNKAVSRAFQGLFASASIPLFEMLCQWILTGSIHDPHKEFFIQETSPCTRYSYWHEHFVLRHELLPGFIPIEVAYILLNAGKTVHFLVRFFPDRVEEELSVSMNKLMQIQDGTLLDFTAVEGSSMNLVQQVWNENGTIILDLIKKESDLTEFFTNVRDYVFLCNGQFSRSFVALINLYMKAPIETVPVELLQKLLKQAMMTSTQTGRSVKNLYKKLHVRYNKVLKGDTVAEVLTLTYDTSGPVKAVFDVYEQTYKKHFAFLYKKNHALFVMANIWKLLRSLQKREEIEPSFREMIKSLFLLNFHLMRFVNQLDFYFVHEVVEKYWSKFMTKYSECETIDDLLISHEKMLEAISTALLLDEPETGLSTQLRNIFNLMDDLEELTISLYVTLTGEHSAEVSAITCQAKLEIVISYIELSLRDFILDVQKCRVEGIKEIHNRINFNNFYTPQNGRKM